MFLLHYSMKEHSFQCNLVQPGRTLVRNYSSLFIQSTFIFIRFVRSPLHVARLIGDMWGQESCKPDLGSGRNLFIVLKLLLLSGVISQCWCFVSYICRVWCLAEEGFTLKGKMLSPNDPKLEKRDPFYRSLVAKQKTSAEIISEARNALRTVGTQRPFTPQEGQRKLFGPASSRTSENRPPSSFR